MKPADARSLMLALRAWLDDNERNGRRLAELIYAKAMRMHAGYVRYLFTAVDGPIRPTAEDEMTSDGSVIVVADDGRADRTFRAA